MVTVLNNGSAPNINLSAEAADAELDLTAGKISKTSAAFVDQHVPDAQAWLNGVKYGSTKAVQQSSASPGEMLKAIAETQRQIAEWQEIIAAGDVATLPPEVKQLLAIWLAVTDRGAVVLSGRSEEPDEPNTDELDTDEPKTDESKTDEPKTDELDTDEPKTDEPKTDEPKPDEPNTSGGGSNVRVKLDDLIASGRSFNLLGRLFVESATLNYQAERLVTQTHMNDAYTAIMNQVGKIRDQAEHMKKAADAKFGSAVAAAAIQIVGGLALGYKAGKAGIVGAGGMEHNAKFQAYNGVVSGIAGLTNSIGQFVADLEQVDVKKAEADATKFAADAARINALLEERKSHIQQLMAQLQALLEAIKQVLEAAIEALAAVTRKG